MEEEQHNTRRRAGLKPFLAGIAADLADLAETVGNVVQSAGELLLDNELRRKGANMIAQEAAKTISDAQRGIEAGAETLQQGARARIGAGAQRLQSVLRNIERQIQDFQRQQLQRDLQSELEHHHKLPVDIQVGDQVFEDMPQEMRTRFWYVLLERPDLAQGLTRRAQRNLQASRPGHCVLVTEGTAGSGPEHSSSTAAGAAAQGSSTDAVDAPHITAQAAAAAVAATIGEDELASSSQQATGSDSSAPGLQQDGMAAEDSGAVPAGGSPFAAYSSGPQTEAAKAAAAGEQEDAAVDTESPAEAAKPAAGNAAAVGHQTTQDAPDIDDLLAQQSTGVEPLPIAAAGVDSSAAGAALAAAIGSPVPAAATGGGCNSSGSCAVQITPETSAPSPWLSVQAPSSCSSSPSKPSAPNPWQHLALADAGSSSPGQQTAAAPAAATSPSLNDGDGGWEIIPDDLPSGDAALDSLRSLVRTMAQSEDSLDASRACQAAVFQAMLHEVPWLAGEGMPQEIDPHGEYAQLLAAGCGSIEDVISRDVPRTFPEHPLFSAQEGQQRLLRLLKAYAAADPEVGYCQGMAFAAGILLMYLPEEPAFLLYRRLMMKGPTLRRLYLPGLIFLKLELSRFQLLLSSHTPKLHQHLLDAGLPALLYAAQWLMTCYACPFPVHVAARVLDILLQSDDDAILLRLGLAVMGALEEQLLELQDFEELITTLKVTPLSWPMHTIRKVLQEALDSPASDAELAATTAAVQAEFQRLGRFSSFSSSQMAPPQLQQQQQQEQGHGTAEGATGEGASSSSSGQQSAVQLEPLPGPVEPHTEASAAALASQRSAEPGQPGASAVDEEQHQHQQQALQAAVQLAVKRSMSLGSLRGSSGSLRRLVQPEGQQENEVEPAESGVLGEMDAALIDMMADMDMDIVMPTLPAVGGGPAGGSNAQ